MWGGVTGWNRIATFAAAHDVGMSPDWFHQIHVHLVSAASNGLFVEYFPDDTVFNFGWLVDHELEVRDGSLVLPDRSGVGVEFVEEAVGRYALAILVDMTRRAAPGGGDRSAAVVRHRP